MGGGVLEARHLRVLRDQVEDRVEHQVDERELSVQAGCREVSDGYFDVLGSGLGAQAGHHSFRVVDTGYRDAALGKRKRDPACADRELERPALPGKADE